MYGTYWISLNHTYICLSKRFELRNDVFSEVFPGWIKLFCNEIYWIWAQRLIINIDNYIWIIILLKEWKTVYLVFFNDSERLNYEPYWKPQMYRFIPGILSVHEYPHETPIEHQHEHQMFLFLPSHGVLGCKREGHLDIHFETTQELTLLEEAWFNPKFLFYDLCQINLTNLYWL